MGDDVRANRESVEDDEWLSVEECIEYYVAEHFKNWSGGRQSKVRPALAPTESMEPPGALPVEGGEPGHKEETAAPRSKSRLRKKTWTYPLTSSPRSYWLPPASKRQSRSQSPQA
jgi:hypothetical protein